MRHLVNTFLDGGESAEKKWLEPLLAASIKDAPFRLRLSHDVTKLLHALAKCLGEGIGLYGRGEGASKFRPWLEKNHKSKLYWHLSRVDKGTRQDSKTEGPAGLRGRTAKTNSSGGEIFYIQKKTKEPIFLLWPARTNMEGGGSGRGANITACWRLRARTPRSACRTPRRRARTQRARDNKVHRIDIATRATQLLIFLYIDGGLCAHLVV